MSKSKHSKYRFTDDGEKPTKSFNWLNAKSIRREKKDWAK